MFQDKLCIRGVGDLLIDGKGWSSVGDDSSSDRTRSYRWRSAENCTGLSVETRVSNSLVYQILMNGMKMSHVCAQWLTRLLSDKENVNRRFIHSQCSSAFLHRIYTVDETRDAMFSVKINEWLSYPRRRRM